jgi:hypothetical protein
MPRKRAWSHAFPHIHLILELWRDADLLVQILISISVLWR